MSTLFLGIIAFCVLITVTYMFVNMFVDVVKVKGFNRGTFATELTKLNTLTFDKNQEILNNHKSDIVKKIYNYFIDNDFNQAIIDVYGNQDIEAAKQLVDDVNGFGLYYMVLSEKDGDKDEDKEKENTDQEPHRTLKVSRIKKYTYSFE